MAIVDYFQGFERKKIHTGEVEINTLVGGSGDEAILMLHGHPQSYLIWRDIAPGLTDKYTVVATDLRGYGDSSKPRGLPDHSNYSKRVMAQDQVTVMEKLGFTKFHVISHDRGARVAHRMLLDHSEKTLTCTLMDILPTNMMYEDTNQEFATKYWHWFFYIQKYDFPERLLGPHPDYFIRTNLLNKLGPTAKENFPEDVIEEYVRYFSDPACVHAICEDYRASVTIDMEHDGIDRDKRITTPLIALWGANGVVGGLWDVLKGWRERADDVNGFGVPDCGHFVPEEQPQICLEAIKEFLSKK